MKKYTPLTLAVLLTLLFILSVAEATVPTATSGQKIFQFVKMTPEGPMVIPTSAFAEMQKIDQDADAFWDTTGAYMSDNQLDLKAIADEKPDSLLWMQVLRKTPTVTEAHDNTTAPSKLFHQMAMKPQDEEIFFQITTRDVKQKTPIVDGWISMVFQPMIRGSTFGQISEQNTAFKFHTFQDAIGSRASPHTNGTVDMGITAETAIAIKLVGVQTLTARQDLA